MNGDFGASVEDESHEESSGQSSAVSSPAARWFAPAKQPLRTESGKHWSKSRRGELGVGSPAPGDQNSEAETPTIAQPEIVSPNKTPAGGIKAAQQPRKLSTAEQTDYNTAQNSMSALNLHSAGSPAPNSTERRPSLEKDRSQPAQQTTPPRTQPNPGENAMRRPSVGKDQHQSNHLTQQAVQHSTPQRPTPAATSSEPSQQPQRTPQQQPPTNSAARRPSDNAPANISPTKSALASSNSAVLSMSNLYEKPVSYKYLPLELASAAPVKNSIARNILFQSLGHGLLVIKHGRKGGPKKRVLYCDHGATKLFWKENVLSPEEVHKHGIDSLIDPHRTVQIADILEVRAGVDLDPDTTTAALRTAARNGVQEAVMLLAKREDGGNVDSGKEGKSEKRSLVQSLFGGGGGSEKDGELLYGTAILRKKVKPEEFSKCLSLITADRSYDFQCFSKKDYNLLYINLKEIVTKLRNPTVLPAEVAPIVNEYRETLSAKKSVRFMFEGEEAEQKADEPPAHEAVSPDRESLSLPSASSDVMHLNSVTDIDALLAPGISSKSRVKLAESDNHGRRHLLSESVDSDSGHDPNTFSDARDMNRTMSSLSGLTGMSLAQATDTTVSSGGSMDDYPGAPGVRPAAAALTAASSDSLGPSAQNPYRMRAHEALQIGLLLAQQEQDFGTNMYQSLTPEDEPEIEHLNALGFSTEEAILKIFQKKFQPEAADEEEIIAPSRSLDAGFDYTDQFDPANSWFKGSTKGFGRQSSFFPPVFQPDTVPEEGSESDSKRSNQTADADAQTDAKRRHDRAQKALEAQNWIDAIPPPAPAKASATKATKVPPNPASLESLPRPRQPLPGPPQAPSSSSKLPPPPSYEESATHPTVSTSSAATAARGDSQSDLIGSANSSVKSSVSSNDSLPTSARGRPSAALSPPQDVRHREMMYRPPETPDASPVRGVAEPILRMSSCDALQIGLLLSQQEAEFGTNMYDSLENSDEPAIRRLVAQGYTNDEAVLEIFNMKFGKTGPRTTRSPVLPAAPTTNHYQPPPAPHPVPAPAPMPVPQPYPYHYGQMGQPPAPYGYAPAPMPGPYGHPAPAMAPGTPYQQPLPPGAMHQSMYGMATPTPPPMMPMAAPYATPGPGARPAMHRTNSLAQSSFFPNDPHVMQAPYHPAAAGGLQVQPPAPQAAGGNWRPNSGLSPRSTTRSNMLSTLSDEEAVQMALLLSQQEAEFGVNMYDALRPQDEPELQALIASGYTNEQAVLCLFERRYPPRGGRGLSPPQQQLPSGDSSWGSRGPLPPQQIPSRDNSWDRPGTEYSGGMYPSPGAAPPQRMPPQRQPSMMPQPGPVRMQSVYNMTSPPPPASMPQEAVPVVVTAIPLALDDANEVQAHAQRAGVAVPVPAAVPAAAPAPQRGLNRQGSTMSAASPAALVPVPQRGLNRQGSTMSVSSPAAPAPAPQRGLNRQPSTMSVASSDPAPAGGRPQLTKKRSIFNFTVGGGGGRAADEIAPEKKLKFKENDVKAITSMGYTREQAIWALVQNNNNVPMAIDALCRS